MTQTRPSSTGALLGVLSILRGGFTLKLSPCARSAPDDDPLSCREDLVPSGDRMRRSIRRYYNRALVLHGAVSATIRSAPCDALCATTAATSP